MMKNIDIEKDASKRVEWINKRMTLTDLQKDYIKFQIMDAIIEYKTKNK